MRISFSFRVRSNPADTLPTDQPISDQPADSHNMSKQLVVVMHDKKDEIVSEYVVSDDDYRLLIETITEIESDEGVSDICGVSFHTAHKYERDEPPSDGVLMIVRNSETENGLSIMPNVWRIRTLKGMP